MTTAPQAGASDPPRPATAHRTRFFDHRIPSLHAGRYEIHNGQLLRDTDGADRPLDGTPQPFDVIQPRFAIAPTAVNARYPVPDAVGTYSEVLPHINLDTPELPWARPLGDLGEHDESIPWMALFVFRPGELDEDLEAVGAVTVDTVRKLLAGEHGPGRPPDIDPKSLRPDECDENCVSIHVPAALFDRVKPLPTEMAYLAHVREGGKPDATRAGSSPEPDIDQLNAVVVANRFPDARGGLHVCHLVSLEGHDDALTEPAAEEGVRLVSLTSWTFETRPDDGTGFGDMVQRLATTDGVTPRRDLRLRVPVTEPANVTEPQREALDRVAGGATTLPQRLPTGERTIAFHRGPFTALKPQPLPDPGEGRVRLDSSGEALVYLEKYGVFDTSYAAAFTTGRTLALADADYRKALLEFRKAARFAVRRLASHPRLVGRAVSARQLTAPLAIESFDRMLLDDDGARLGRAVREAPAAMRAGRRRTTTRARRTTGDIGTLLADTSVRSLVREAAGDEFEGVRAWLDRLRLLEIATFDNLVPDTRMLPQESIRFFHVDPEWIRAAVDGALSVGVGHALDADLNSLAVDGGPVPECGVLVRSSLIPGWPTTIFTGLRAEVDVEPLRTADYGTDVRLVLYPRVIDRFEIAEPPRGICFGVGNVGTIELREIDGPRIGYPMGEFPADADFGAYLRDRETGVLNIGGSGTALLDGLDTAHGGVRLTSAQFALQMIQAPQVQSFTRL
ncbi:hypothetical protein [Embleya hyalina]|uniref:Uncharacterized protein n=1 Tax=Embleya hyalina TaxID=516124 RepID=A0A401Z5W7_9ACTN|nr:hypothetical protein [Embleya hyalina]GCE02244.1 hypothetical protein EHYA_10021 [Embleya hyalina]